MPTMVRLLLLSLSPISCSTVMIFPGDGCSSAKSDTLNHAIVGLGLPVARQEKVASSGSTTVRLSGGSRICGGTGKEIVEVIHQCILTR